MKLRSLACIMVACLALRTLPAAFAQTAAKKTSAPKAAPKAPAKSPSKAAPAVAKKPASAAKTPVAASRTSKTSTIKSSTIKTSAGKTGTTKTAKGKAPVKKVAFQPRQSAPTPDRLKEIQGALASKGYLKSEPSGVWDSESIDAMKRYQADQKLDPSGKITAAALIGLGLGSSTAAPLPPVTAPATSPANTPTTSPATSPTQP